LTHGLDPDHQPAATAIAPTDGGGPAFDWPAVTMWLGLVSVAVIGRLLQPHWNGEPLWNVTPMAGIALAAGAVFRRPLVAASVPLAALALSNLAMPSYGSTAMAAVVYAATAWPVLLGGLVRKGRLPAVVGGALATSLVFFVSTNFAHWLLGSDYPANAAGLLACFVAALPFYRWMPVGDIVWSLVIFGGLAACGHIGIVAGRRAIRRSA
jgi:hypothetical protein